MAAPQPASQRSRWFDLCLAAAAGSALATGAALYWRYRSGASSSSQCVCGAAAREGHAEGNAAAVHDVPSSEPDRQQAHSQWQPHHRQQHQEQDWHQPQQQEPLLQRRLDAGERCRHDSAQSVDTSALAIWQQVGAGTGQVTPVALLVAQSDALGRPVHDGTVADSGMRGVCCLSGCS